MKGPGVIPKILHFIWMQGLDQMPKRYRLCFDTWAPQHPDWEIRLWSRYELPALENEWVFQVDNPTVQSDVARIELVHKFGGIYLDCDMQCRRPLDTLLEGKRAFTSMRNLDPEWDENAGFGAEPGHPWLACAIKKVQEARARINRVLDIDGPWRLARESFPDVPRLPYTTLNISPDDLPGLVERAYAIHHRLSVWMRTDERFLRGFIAREANACSVQS